MMHERRLAEGVFIKPGCWALKSMLRIRLLSDNTGGNVFQYLDCNLAGEILI